MSAYGPPLLWQENKRLRAKLERAEAALREFADEGNWETSGHSISWIGTDGDPAAFAGDVVSSVFGDPGHPVQLCEDQPGEWIEDCTGCSQCGRLADEEDGD